MLEVDIQMLEDRIADLKQDKENIENLIEELEKELIELEIRKVD